MCNVITFKKIKRMKNFYERIYYVSNLFDQLISIFEVRFSLQKVFTKSSELSRLDSSLVKI